MKKNFLHKLTDSFRLFLEHEVLDKGEAFRNVSGSLYKIQDHDFPNKHVYSNPYGQWVFDSSIPTANVPSGIYSNGNFIPRGSGNLQVDYMRGRAVSDVALPNVTAAYAVKDFNFYSTTKSDAQIIYGAKNNFRPKYNVPMTGLMSDQVVTPSVFIRRSSSTNEPFAFGGQDNTVTYFNCIILTNNEYDLDGVGGIFTDAAKKNFMLLDNSPFNRYGDIASRNSYSYPQDVMNNYNSANQVYISEVDYYRFDAHTETILGIDFKLGFAEFKTEIARWPRI